MSSRRRDHLSDRRIQRRSRGSRAAAAGLQSSETSRCLRFGDARTFRCLSHFQRRRRTRQTSNVTCVQAMSAHHDHISAAPQRLIGRLRDCSQQRLDTALGHRRDSSALHLRVKVGGQLPQPRCRTGSARRGTVPHLGFRVLGEHVDDMLWTVVVGCSVGTGLPIRILSQHGEQIRAASRVVGCVGAHPRRVGYGQPLQGPWTVRASIVA